MSAQTRFSIWNRPFGTIETAIVFGALGATVCFILSGMNATAMTLAIQVLVFAGMGTFAAHQHMHHRLNSTYTELASIVIGAASITTLSIPIWFLFGWNAALLSICVVGAVCGLIISLVGDWILITTLVGYSREALKLLRRRDQHE
jgi:hypothetical protein